MGCSTSRENITKEEFAITKGETALGYSKIHVRQIIIVTKRYGGNQKMLESHFDQYCRLLNLAMNPNTDPASQLGQFYRKFAWHDVYD
jgi:hypothetical protein